MDSLSRYAAIALLSIGLVAEPVQAQVTPDSTLSTAVRSPDGRNFAIEGGAQSGNNLFHSFSQFTVPTTGSATFNNALDVQNIFARVTGGSISNVDGVLSTNGRANLFLLNPSGLQFGPNAQLNLGGSFLGTTASSVQFADGLEFSAVNPAPLLTISVPTSLQMGQNSGAIQVLGQGSSFTSANAVFAPIQKGNTQGLAVRAGQTLALIGNSINLTGSTLTAEQGRIELGSVSAGMVGLESVPSGFQLRYQPEPALSNISLTQQAAINASGGGNIHLRGNQVSFQDGSMALIQNQGNQAGGSINLTAKDVILSGTTPDGSLLSGLNSPNLSSQPGAAIAVVADSLQATAGAGIQTRTFSDAVGGNIQLSIATSLDLSGYAAPNNILGSSILSSTLGSGQAGNTEVTAGQILLLEGGFIASSTFGPGSTGNVKVQAQDIQAIGMTPSFSPSSINAIAFGPGNAGTVDITTQRLTVLDGAQINSSTFNKGDAGSLTIRADESIIVSGFRPGYVEPSFIGSLGLLSSPLQQKLFGLPPAPSGVSGNVNLFTKHLQVSDQAKVTVGNAGSGNAGFLLIQADRIDLKDQGRLTASTQSGEGGNIRLQVSDRLLMRRGGLISAEAKGNGQGGNLLIKSPTIVGADNSDIVANAFQGRGGNIEITTQGIIGLKYRDRLTPGNDIAASSEFGISGTVQVNTIGVNPSADLAVLPVDPVDSSQKIATGCGSTQDSSFIATGRGGTASNPSQIVTLDRAWSDLRSIASAKPEPRIAAAAMPIEATSFTTNSRGQTELIGSGRTAQIVATCAR
jgi:filamentous hemagglutinin family protein